MHRALEIALQITAPPGVVGRARRRDRVIVRELPPAERRRDRERPSIPRALPMRGIVFASWADAQSL